MRFLPSALRCYSVATPPPPRPPPPKRRTDKRARPRLEVPKPPTKRVLAAPSSLTTSVKLTPLPPTLTLSDLGRLALCAGAAQFQVLGLTIGTDLSVAGTPQLSGTIHFSSNALAQKFAASPLVFKRLEQEGNGFKWVPTTPAATVSDSTSQAKPEEHLMSVESTLVDDAGYAPNVVESYVTRQRSRWIYFRVPGEVVVPPAVIDLWSNDSEVPSESDPQADETGSEVDETNLEADETDLESERYAEALSKALAREEQLEQELARQRALARDAAVKHAHLVVKTQIYQDCGVYGPIQDVRLRPFMENRKGIMVHRLEALVGFGHVHAALRCQRALPLVHPVYLKAGVMFSYHPWPDASGYGHTAPLNTATGDATRLGWTKEVETELQREVRISAEREGRRQGRTDTASGTWNKPTLSEIRARVGKSNRL